MLSKHRILTQVAGHAMDVMKILPPLIIGEKEVEMFVNALDDVLTECRKFPGPMWEIGNNFVRHALGSKRAVATSRPVSARFASGYPADGQSAVYYCRVFQCRFRSIRTPNHFA